MSRIKTEKLLFLLLLTAGTIFAAAASDLTKERYIRSEFTVTRVKDFVFAQGFDHPAWCKTPVYTFMRQVVDVSDIRRLPRESGKIQALYDNDYLYLRAEFADSDIVNIAKKSGGHLYRDGDLLELFMRPADKKCYWEIYGTPNNLHTVFFYPQPGRRPDCTVSPQFRVKTRLNGTLGDPADRDKGFTLLMAVPLSEFEKSSVKFAPGSSWLILTGRYNYTRYLDRQDISSYPQCSGSFHNHQYYAKIRFAE